MLRKMVKRVMSITLAVALVLGMTACGSKESDADQYEVPEMGIQYTIPKDMMDKGIEVSPYNWNMNEYYLSTIDYYYRPVTDALFDEMLSKSPEEQAAFEAEFYEKMYAHSRTLLSVVALEKEEYDKNIAEGKSLDEISCFDHTEELTEKDGYVYLLSIPEYELKDVSEEEKQQFNECHEYMQTVKNSIQINGINEDLMAGETPASLGEFKSTDLDGNEVTDSIFAEKDLTVVNIWGTFCGPCIEEMPELGEWAKEMPENVQIVGLVQDISGTEDQEHVELAKQITSKANADFLQIIAGTNDFAEVMSSLVGVPTTIFVDKSGNVVGEPIVGADVEGYKTFVEEYLNEQ